MPALRYGWSVSPPAACGWPSACARSCTSMLRSGSSTCRSTATTSPQRAQARRAGHADRVRRRRRSHHPAARRRALHRPHHPRRDQRAVRLRPAGERRSWRCWSTAAAASCRCRPTARRRTLAAAGATVAVRWRAATTAASASRIGARCSHKRNPQLNKQRRTASTCCRSKACRATSSRTSSTPPAASSASATAR